MDILNLFDSSSRFSNFVHRSPLPIPPFSLTAEHLSASFFICIKSILIKTLIILESARQKWKTEVYFSISHRAELYVQTIAIKIEVISALDTFVILSFLPSDFQLCSVHPT